MSQVVHPTLFISVETRQRAPSNVLIRDPLASIAALVTMEVAELSKPGPSSRLVIFCMDESHRTAMRALAAEPDIDVHITDLAAALLAAAHGATLPLQQGDAERSVGLVLLHSSVRPSVEALANVIAVHLSKLSAMTDACPGCHAHLPFHPAVVEAATCAYTWLYGDTQS